MNGKSISQAELASNSWHEMPGPPRGAGLQRFMQLLSQAKMTSDIRQYLAGSAGSGSSSASATAYSVTSPSSRQNAWSHQLLDSSTVNRFVAGLEIIGGGLETAGGQSRSKILKNRSQELLYRDRLPHSVAITLFCSLERNSFLLNRTQPLQATHKESDDYPTLKGLVRGYFHQDYDIISEDGDEVVAAFRDENLPSASQSLIADIHRFLDLYGSDEKQLTDAFKRIFTPETAFHRFWGRTTREALLKVIEIVSAPATHSYRLPEERHSSQEPARFMAVHYEQRDAYPLLQNLVRCYFDQDYDEISEDLDEIFAYYKAEAFPGIPQSSLKK